MSYPIFEILWPHRRLPCQMHTDQYTEYGLWSYSLEPTNRRSPAHWDKTDVQLFLMYRSDRRNDFLPFCVTLRQTANIRLHCGKNKMAHPPPNTCRDIAVHFLKPEHTNVPDADAENNNPEY